MKQKVLFVRLDPNAKVPHKAHKDDFCFDLVATSCTEVAPNVYKYGTGLALQISDNDKANYRETSNSTSFELRPRSSVWKTGMLLSNCVGTIDEGYTGEISAVFYHVMPDMPRYQVGDRIAQICFQRANELEFKKVDKFNKTERGAGGYGSSGK